MQARLPVSVPMQQAMSTVDSRDGFERFFPRIVGQGPVFLADSPCSTSTRARGACPRNTDRRGSVSLARCHRLAHGFRQDRLHGYCRVCSRGAGHATGVGQADHSPATHLLRRRSARHRRCGARARQALGAHTERGGRRHPEDGCGQSAPNRARRSDGFPGRTAVGGTRTARRHVPLGSLGAQPAAAKRGRVDCRSIRLATAVPGLRTGRFRCVARLRGPCGQRQPRSARRGPLCTAVPADLAGCPTLPGIALGARTLETLLLSRGHVRDTTAGPGGCLPRRV